MAEFVQLPQQVDTEEEREFNPSIPVVFSYEWLIDYMLNFEEIGNILDERVPGVIQQKIDLFQTASYLQTIFIMLLKYKIKLLDVQKNVLNSKIAFLEEILKIFEDYSKNESTHGKPHSQEYRELVKGAAKKFQNKRKEILGEVTEKIVHDIYKGCLKYQELYKKYERSLKEILKHSENKLKICNAPRNCQEDLCILMSILKENLTLCNFTLASSKVAFHDFESLITTNLNASGQNLSKRINLFMTAIEKVEFSYSEAFSIFSEVLNLDCATRALY